jgi:putative membrane protein insertion efficiency factor
MHADRGAGRSPGPPNWPAIGSAIGLVLGSVLLGLIRAYQLLIAPLFPPSCRYYPTCSHYAAEAVALHGPWRGSGLAARRLLRCHPWGGSGYDPVPTDPRS